MYAKDALLGEPPLAFGLDEFPDALGFDESQVSDLAHAVFPPVALVEMLQAPARELGAREAESATAFTAHT